MHSEEKYGKIQRKSTSWVLGELERVGVSTVMYGVNKGNEDSRRTALTEEEGRVRRNIV